MTNTSVPVKGKLQKDKGRGGEVTGNKQHWRQACSDYWRPDGCRLGHHGPKHYPRRQLAVGKEKARCWRNEVYAEDRAHPLLPLGRLANLLDTNFIWENGQAFMQCRKKG